ncbi:MAG: sec-independent translocase [Mycobacteriales bacterium]
MFNNIGWGEVAVLVILGLLVFGPERLPKIAADAGRLVRQLRSMASDVTSDLKSELGPEMADLDLRSLHPRRFIERHLLDGETPDRARAASGQRSALPPYDDEAT